MDPFVKSVRTSMQYTLMFDELNEGRAHSHVASVLCPMLFVVFYNYIINIHYSFRNKCHGGKYYLFVAYYYKKEHE